MSETTGQLLAKARLAKRLSLEEVAHATKLRPDKILALEHGDYGRFASNAYVKGFLQIYGRYLGVDVSAALQELESPNPVSVEDYQYLNSAPPREPEQIILRRQSSRPSVVPLLVFLALAALGLGGGYLYLNARRLGPLDAVTPPGAGTAKTPAPTPEPAPVVDRTEIAAAEPPPAEAPAPVAAPPENTKSDREFIAQPGPERPTTAPTVNDVELEPVKKSWVKIRRDDPQSPPIFEDYLYKNAPSLKLRGKRFFIEIRDEGEIVVRKNGATIPMEGAVVVVQ